MKPSDDAIIAQQFLDALRECLGKAPLYKDRLAPPEERFYVCHAEPLEGMPRTKRGGR